MNAIVICESENSPAIAGVSLLDRLVVALHRGGCERITLVGSRWLTGLPRTEALGIEVERVLNLDAFNEPTLIASDRILVQAADVERLIERGGRLESSEGIAMDIGVLPPGLVTDFRQRFSNQSPVPANGIAMPINDPADALWAARELWNSLGSAADGAVDTWFNRPVGRLLSKLLVLTNVTPNQVSAVATIIGVASGLVFALGGYWAAVIGAVLLQISTIVDCVDGDLARIAFKESAIGKWLDIGGDQVVHIAVFVGVGTGLWKTGFDGPVAALATSAATGVLISFVVVIRGMMLPKSDENALLHKLIDKMTNRDFSVLLIVLSVADKLGWFIWMVGIGVHVFWVLALAAQIIGRRRAAR